MRCWMPCVAMCGNVEGMKRNVKRPAGGDRGIDFKADLGFCIDVVRSLASCQTPNPAGLTGCRWAQEYWFSFWQYLSWFKILEMNFAYDFQNYLHYMQNAENHLHCSPSARSSINKRVHPFLLLIASTRDVHISVHLSSLQLHLRSVQSTQNSRSPLIMKCSPSMYSASPCFPLQKCWWCWRQNCEPWLRY